MHILENIQEKLPRRAPNLNSTLKWLYHSYVTGEYFSTQIYGLFELFTTPLRMFLNSDEDSNPADLLSTEVNTQSTEHRTVISPLVLAKWKG